MPFLSARQEWASTWRVPTVAMLGVSGGGMFIYTSGVFMEPMTHAFGWSRAEFSSAFVLQTILSLFILPPVGSLVDRIGARKVALPGVVMFFVGMMLLTLANGALWQWWLLCLVQYALTACVTPGVWVAAVVERFQTARGAAMAFALSGLGVGGMVWPVLAAFLVKSGGWRLGYLGLGVAWSLSVGPLALLWFFGARDRGGAARPRPEAGAYASVLRSPTFIGLTAAGGLFSWVYIGLLAHLVPLLRSDGLDLTTAAALSGLVGLFSAAGRLGVGFLLDRLPTRPLAIAIFFAPVLVAGLLLEAHGSLVMSAAATALLGLAVGSEISVISYVAASRFGEAVFGAIFSIIIAILAVCSGFGPVLAGAIYDASKSYDLFLLAIIPTMLAATILVAFIPLSPQPALARGQ